MNGGAVGLAGEDAQRAVAGRAAGEVAAHQPADIECAVIVGYQAVVAAAGGAHEAVAGGGAVGDNAVVPPGQHACIGADGAAVQLTVHPHGLAAAGHQHGIAYLAAAGYGGEHTDAAAAVGHEGHAGNGVAAIAVPYSAAKPCALSDRAPAAGHWCRPCSRTSHRWHSRCPAPADRCWSRYRRRSWCSTGSERRDGVRCGDGWYRAYRCRW